MKIKFISYSKTILSANEEAILLKAIEKLTIENDTLKHKIEYNEKAYKKRMKGIIEKLKKQYSDKQHDQDLERRLFNEEIKILKVAILKLKKEKEVYISEIKELKEILRIPRRHFKYLEGINKFEDLVKRKNEYFKSNNLSEDHSLMTYDTRSTRLDDKFLQENSSFAYDKNAKLPNQLSKKFSNHNETFDNSLKGRKYSKGIQIPSHFRSSSKYQASSLLQNPDSIRNIMNLGSMMFSPAHKHSRVDRNKLRGSMFCSLSPVSSILPLNPLSDSSLTNI